MQIRDAARQAFLRFRDQGDPGALAAVFDLVAQQLLLVASHVAGRQQSPEDLLQETFLTAIQRADRYDAERPLEPWLVGILVNVTRNDRRRRQREASGEAVEPAPSEREPSDAAIEAEFLASLDEAIAGLPVPQREVMTLHLVHGMTPTEIAHATSRPVGTVKSWIHRSRDFVRRRLPASMAASFGALLRGMDGLEAVRSVVVEAAARQVAAAGAGATLAGTSAIAAAAMGSAGLPGTTVGASAAPRLLWPWMLAAGLVITGGAWLALPTPSAVPAPEVAELRATPRAVVAAAPDRDALSDRPDSLREAVAPPPVAAPEAPASAVATATVHFVGRFAGEPFAWQGFVVVPSEPDAYLRAVPLCANASGRHSVRGVPFGTYLVQADRANSQWFDVGREEVTVEVPFAGVDVRGRVVDGDGRPVEGAVVATTVDRGFDVRLPVATSDADGRFHVPAALPGRFFEARLPGVLPSGTWQVPEAGALDVELRLGGAGATVVVDVVDERGQPLPQALVQFGSVPLGAGSGGGADPHSAARLPFVGRTDAAGRVVCRELPEGRAVDLFVRATEHAPHLHELAGAVGERHVRLELAAGARVRGVIAGNGDDLAAKVRGVGPWPGEQRPPVWFWPQGPVARDGRYELRGLPAGRVLLQARSRGGALVEHELVLSAGAVTEWSPSFVDRGTLRGRVVQHDGQPFRGAMVGLHAAGRAPHFAVLDEQGAFGFDGLPERRYELTVQCGADAGALVLVRRPVPKLGEPLLVALPQERQPSAVLRGRLQRRPERQVALLDLATGESVPAAVDGDGRFQFEVPPGNYSVVAGGHRIVLRHDVTLAEGASLDLGGVDGAEPCDVSVRCPAASVDAPCEVHAYAEGSPALFGLVVLRGAVGRLSLPPGRYRLSLLRQDELLDQQVLVVGSDAANEVEFAAVPAAVPLRVLAAPLEPQLDLLVHWRIDGPQGRWFAVSRRPGELPPEQAAALLVRLPAGDYTITARRAGGAEVVSSVCVPWPTDGKPPLLRLP
ncbi:MAG: sigma-70 family RNA polymerase sigma factor [Planctomycetes bacterium]|nr:sigma-70 family RNA polymerase sigma factor [Planctomycetota bacterium]